MNKDLQVIGWTEWTFNENGKYPVVEFESCEHRDYIRNLVASELRAKGYKFSGEYHQNGEGGCPVFSDGTKYQSSFREWGGIMALAYPEEINNSDGYGYCDYAWYNPKLKYIYPDKKDILSAEKEKIDEELLEFFFETTEW